MKKLVFSSTGFPTTIKTLEYLQDNTLAAIKGLLGTFEDHRVIWGMNVNPAGTAISEGAFSYQNEVIPFVGGALDGEAPTITINELKEDAGYNSNPSNVEYLEVLPAYVSRAAIIGTGGIHTFLVSKLKRYSEQVVIDSGVTIGEIENVLVHGSGVVLCEHKYLTDLELENTMIIYVLTKENDTQSTLKGAEHFLMRRTNDSFYIAYTMPLGVLELPKILWQIVKFKK